MSFQPQPYKPPTIKVKDYQLSAQFPPDKSASYPFPPEEDLWIHGHNAIRGEMHDLRESLEALVKRLSKGNTELETWEVSCLEIVWNAHYQYLEAHHHHEEHTVGSVAKRRFRWPEHVSSTHSELESMLQHIDQQVKDIRKVEGGSLVATQKLLATWSNYQKEMLEHLEFEEENLIPLVRAYLSHQDMCVLFFQILRKVPKSEVGAVIHYTGDEHIRTVSLKFQGVPDWTWPFFFQPAVSKYRRTIVASVEAIRSGIPPPVSGSDESFISRCWHWIFKPFFLVLELLGTRSEGKGKED